MRRSAFVILVAAAAGCQPQAQSPSLPGMPSPRFPAASSAQVVAATSLKLDGVEKVLPRDFTSTSNFRGTTFTVGNQDASGTFDVPTVVFGLAGKVDATTTSGTAGLQNLHWYAKQGSATVEQTYMWDGTPESETVTFADGKATYAFKGKVKRILVGTVGPASMQVEGTISGIPL